MHRPPAAPSNAAPPFMPNRATSQPRILFVSEAITLAQIVRLVVLARALDPLRFDLHFASAHFPGAIFDGTPFTRWPLYSVPRKRIDRALATGRRLYGVGDLERYLRSDLEVLDAVQPDLVIGDFRWSLNVSAPLRSVPYATLINAFWSPYARFSDPPLPDHPMTTLLGPERAARYFPMALPYVFRHFSAPMNTLRRRYALPPIGSLREVLTHGSYTLYADTPRIAPTTSDLPATHQYLGPVLWSPRGELPDEWGRDPARLPVYVTLGSSGRVDLLPTVLDGLEALPVDVLVATAGRFPLSKLPAGVWGADLVPGNRAAARAALVIANGGSTTAYQALAAGTPVIGIPYNFDQYLTMAAIERVGAGVWLRSTQLTAQRLERAVLRVLADTAMRKHARQAATDFRVHSAAERFRRFVDIALRIPALPLVESHT